MNILITGASRGIGAAAYNLLKSRGHNVAGHSSRGSDELIAGDLTDASAPKRIWEAALGRLGGRIDALVNNAGVYESVAQDIDEVEQGFGRFSEQIANFKSSAKAFVSGMAA